jgi:UDP-N-acetylglucosamine transferase subunit ALG13
VIFVTVGTNEAPFERLLRAVETLGVDEEVIVQSGSGVTRPKGARCVPFLDFPELVSYVREARAVVMHAGVGSIMVALREGRRPIVVPRLRRFGEAVDDHQLHFARRAAVMGSVLLVEDDRSLGAVLGSEQSAVSPLLPGASVLAEEIRDFLRQSIRAA